MPSMTPMFLKGTPSLDIVCAAYMRTVSCNSVWGRQNANTLCSISCFNANAPIYYVVFPKPYKKPE